MLEQGLDELVGACELVGRLEDRPLAVLEAPVDACFGHLPSQPPADGLLEEVASADLGDLAHPVDKRSGNRIDPGVMDGRHHVVDRGDGDLFVAAVQERDVLRMGIGVADEDVEENRVEKVLAARMPR